MNTAVPLFKTLSCSWTPWKKRPRPLVALRQMKEGLLLGVLLS